MSSWQSRLSARGHSSIMSSMSAGKWCGPWRHNPFLRERGDGERRRESDSEKGKSAPNSWSVFNNLFKSTTMWTAAFAALSNVCALFRHGNFRAMVLQNVLRQNFMLVVKIRKQPFIKASSRPPTTSTETQKDPPPHQSVFFSSLSSVVVELQSGVRPLVKDLHAETMGCSWMRAWRKPKLANERVNNSSEEDTSHCDCSHLRHASTTRLCYLCQIFHPALKCSPLHRRVPCLTKAPRLILWRMSSLFDKMVCMYSRRKDRIKFHAECWEQR